jgi:hypothetical protein
LIWQQLVASQEMNPKRRQELVDIITQAELSLGREKIFTISDQIPPVFVGQSTEQHYQNSWKQLLQQRAKWQHVFRNQ